MKRIKLMEKVPMTTDSHSSLEEELKKLSQMIGQT